MVNGVNNTTDYTVNQQILHEQWGTMLESGEISQDGWNDDRIEAEMQFNDRAFEIQSRADVFEAKLNADPSYLSSPEGQKEKNGLLADAEKLAIDRANFYAGAELPDDHPDIIAAKGAAKEWLNVNTDGDLGNNYTLDDTLDDVFAVYSPVPIAQDIVDLNLPIDYPGVDGIMNMLESVFDFESGKGQSGTQNPSNPSGGAASGTNSQGAQNGAPPIQENADISTMVALLESLKALQEHLIREGKDDEAAQLTPLIAALEAALNQQGQGKNKEQGQQQEGNQAEGDASNQQSAKTASPKPAMTGL